MATATHKIRADLAMFSSRELAEIREKDLHASSELRRTNPRKWEAGLAYADDPDFRAAIEASEAEARHPKPQPAPAQPCSIALAADFATEAGICAVERVRELTSGFANASRVAEIESALDVRLRELEVRQASFEQRTATVEARHAAQFRHLQNLESKIRKLGSLENAFLAEKGDDSQ